MTVPATQVKFSRTYLLCGVAACVLTVGALTVATVEAVVPRAVQAAMAAARPPTVVASGMQSSSATQATQRPAVPMILYPTTPVASPAPQVVVTQPTLPPVNNGTAYGGLPPPPSALPDQIAVGAFITEVTHGQGQLVSEFSGPYGLTGAVLEGSQPGQTQKIVGWILPNMQGMFVGSLLDPSGNNLTQAAFNTQGIALPSGTPASGAAIPARPSGMPVQISPQTLSAEMMGEGFKAFSEGSGPTHLTIFMDPNCSYCHLLWQELQAIPNYQSKFTIQWIPVSIVGPTSAGRGAAIIQGMTIPEASGSMNLAPGVTAIDYDETNFNAADETGGIPPSADPAALDEIGANTDKWKKLMGANGQQPGTPTIIVNGTRIIVGAPDQQSLEALASAPAPQAP
jgi:thiol:disulfide interchange protein DsbG